MKTNNLLLLAAISLTGVVAACTLKEEMKFSEGGDPVSITVTIPDEGISIANPDDEEGSKVSLTPYNSSATSKLVLKWEATDVITVRDVNDPDKEAVFTYTSGAGTKTAVFTALGGVSALSSSTAYNIILTSNLPGGFTSQTQDSNGSTSHLGYAVALNGVNTYEAVTFSSNWAYAHGNGGYACSSVLRICAQLPSQSIASSVRKVIVKSSSAIFDGGNELSVAINNPGASDKIVTIYATLPAGTVDIPANTGFVYQFQVSNNDYDKYTAYRKQTTSDQFIASRCNTIKIDCPNIASYANYDNTNIGTESNPYLIGDCHQMDAMHSLITDASIRYFKMVDDVDLTPIAHWEPLSPGYDNHRQIFFDGGGHEISNLTVDNVSDNPSFIGYLWGKVSNVVFDGATIVGTGTTNNHNCAVVAGYAGSQGHQADFEGITVRNSSVTTAGGNAAVGGMLGRVGKCSEVTNCHVINTEIQTSAEVGYAGGMIAYLASNCGCTVINSSVERITLKGCGSGNINTSGVGGMATSGHVVKKCHTTGDLGRGGRNKNCVGGLVGAVTGTTLQIRDSYSSCYMEGQTGVGGIVGHIVSGSAAVLDHCFSSSDINVGYGYGASGGIVGLLQSADVTVSNCVAWNDRIKQRSSDDYSGGAVVGYTHPNCTLTNNYRKYGITYTNIFWSPSSSFDHANVSGTGTPLKVLTGTSPYESNMTNGDAAKFGYSNTSATNYKRYYAYQGKHLASSAVVTPDDTYGWVSDDIPGGSDPDPDPEASGWSDTPTIDLVALGGTKYTLRTGVEYYHFHGTWDGQVREINVIRTKLSSTNHFGIFHDYSHADKDYLDEKCNYLNAVAGTNGCMTSQFVRVNDFVKSSARDAAAYICDCAITVDGNNINIVKVASNFEAAMLGAPTVGCAGPLLVWKGITQSRPEEGSQEFLDDTHPRTVIGISKSREYIIQITVDGRWTSSTTSQRAIGMSTPTLAKLAKGLGCYKAMNLDGGGGSQMWVSGKGDKHNIVNHPHNEWPTYGCGSGSYYWIKNNEVARRASSCAFYIY